MSEPATDPGCPVVDFDHHDPGLARDPYPQYEALRTQSPVAWTEKHDGYWVISDYETVRQVARDDRTFSSASGTIPPHPGPVAVPIETDAPFAQQCRRLLHEQMTPAAAKAMEPRIQAITDELFDVFTERGECDLIDEFAGPLPARTLLPWLGFPEPEWNELFVATSEMSHYITSDPGRAFLGVYRIIQSINALMEERRQSGLRDDIVSALMSGTIDGEPLADEDVVSFLLTLIFGSLDTTTSAFGNAMIRIDRQPELRERLLREPELMPLAVEEFVRLDAPIQSMARRATTDVEVGGCRISEGDRVLLVYASANRDEKAFESPDDLALDRLANPHLGFGVGLHRCLGSNFARTMLRIMLETTLRRIPDFEIVGDPVEYRYADLSSVYSVEKLPVTFSPTPALAPRAAPAPTALLGG